MSLHSALHWDYLAALSPSVASEKLLESPPSVSVPASRLGWALAFLAGTMVASVVAIFWPSAHVDRARTAFLATNRSRESVKTASQTDSLAALVVDQVGAEFAEGRAPDGIRIGPGEYELLKGIVHIRFAQGADVVIASPARLDVRDAQHTRLVYGNVRVTAPPTARGFTIATNAADYVDLGTEFGLRVDPRSGASDLYVFDGQVNVADPRTGKVLSEVVEGESSRYVDGTAGAVPEIDEDEFPTPGAIGYKRWQHYEHQLRADERLLAFFPFRRLPRGGVIIQGQFDDKVTEEAVPVGKWTHVASVMSTQTLSQQIYVNGVLARERQWRIDEILRPGICRLGNWLPDAKACVANRAFRGRIDDLAIWSRALSVNEIKNFVEIGRPGLLWNQ